MSEMHESRKRARDALASSRVRPEAQPLRWDALTDEQQRVAADLHEWLESFIQQPLDEAERRADLGPFSYQKPTSNRSANVILIDGGRGSGKTSILITLLDLWAQAAAGRDLSSTLHASWRERPGPGRGASSVARPVDPVATIIERLTGTLARKLVPVRALDLQPLPPSTSLLTWVAARILEFVKNLENPRGHLYQQLPAEPIASWEPAAERELTSLKEWKDLMQCAALGWDSNLPARRGALDPETYAEELKFAEQARLTTLDYWRRFTTAVVDNAHALHPGLVDWDARLIIPIDDADMNPQRCVELLELLRSLWWPRVIFVLTGHSELFLKTLKLHYGRLLGREARPGTDTPEEPPGSGFLAAQAYDKAIPPAHRFSLQLLEQSERFTLLDDLLDGAIQMEFTRESKKPTSLPPATLREYFTLAPGLQQGLPTRLRSIQNLRQSLLGLRGNVGQQVLRLWQDAVDERDWDHETRRELRALLSLGPEQGLQVSLSDHFTHDTYRIVTLPALTVGCRLLVNAITGYSIAVKLRDGRVLRLSDCLSAVLLLATAVAADDSRGRFHLLHPLPDHAENPLCMSQLPHPEQPATSLVFSWPLPAWRSPVDILVFSELWRQRLRNLLECPVSEPLQSGKGLYERWQREMLRLLLVGVCHVSRCRKVDGLEAAGAGEPDTPESWMRSIMEARQRNLESQPWSRRVHAFQDWAMTEAPLLAAPEYGLAPDLANPLLSAWLRAALPEDDLPSRERILLRLRQQRRRRAALALSRAGVGEGVEALLELIDARYPGYAWAGEVETQRRRALTPEQGERLLDNVLVKHASGSTAHAPSTLAGYVRELEAWPLLETRDQTRFGRLEQKLRHYEPVKGVAALAVSDLWRFVLEEVPLQDRARWEAAIQVRGTELRVELPEPLRQRLDRPHLFRVRDSASRGELGTGGALSFIRVPWWLETPPRALQAVLEVANDVCADEQDMREQEARPRKGARSRGSVEEPRLVLDGALPHLVTLLPYESMELEVDWLVPRWNTFLDWRLTTRLWEKCLGALWSFEKASHLPPTVTGAVAHALLEGIIQIAEQRSLSRELFDFQVEADTLGRDGQEVRALADSFVGPWHGHRGTRIATWARSTVALFGAPETGLPAPFAEAFLETWDEGHSTVRSSKSWQAERARVVQLRRERARVSLERAGLPVTDTYVSRLLADIDSRLPAHPWHRFFGRAAGRPSSPARARARAQEARE